MRDIAISNARHSKYNGVVKESGRLRLAKEIANKGLKYIHFAICRATKKSKVCQVMHASFSTLQSPTIQASLSWTPHPFASPSSTELASTHGSLKSRWCSRNGTCGRSSVVRSRQDSAGIRRTKRRTSDSQERP